ncbi:MAG: repeat-containing protein [Pedosphaera sp.]|nr:repeat-containing protein [Pedosphaera sp.]
MSNLLAGLLSALVATNQPVAVSNLITDTTGIHVNIPDPNDPVEKEYQKVMTDDDAAQAEVDTWIRENRAFVEKGGGAPNDVLNRRINERLALVRKEYEDFLQRHPDHANAHIAFGSFLNDIRDEDGAEAQWEKGRELNPKNPAAWNNLANHYGHDGPVSKAFEYYAKAIELNPTESIYYQNLATTVFLFRKDAMEYYKIDEQQVFNKALELYQQAVKYDPDDFALASDVAQTYYGIKPFRTEEALNAWTNALKVAETEIEREGVYVHFARIKLHAEQFAESRRLLNSVTNEFYFDLKKRLTRNLDEQEKAKATNAPAAEIKAADKINIEGADHK